MFAGKVKTLKQRPLPTQWRCQLLLSGGSRSCGPWRVAPGGPLDVAGFLGPCRCVSFPCGRDCYPTLRAVLWDGALLHHSARMTVTRFHVLSDLGKGFQSRVSRDFRCGNGFHAADAPGRQNSAATLTGTGGPLAGGQSSQHESLRMAFQ